MSPKRRRATSRSITGELVIVLAIVGLLASVAIPMQRRYLERARIGEARQRLAQLVEDARDWARAHRDSSGRPVWPDSLAESAEGPGTARFVYAIAAGAGEDASSRPLRVEAIGKPDGRFEDFRIVVSLDDVEAAPREAVVMRP